MTNLSEVNETTTLMAWENDTLPSIHVPLFVISQEWYDSFALITNVIISPCICLFGLVGNVLGLGVLWRDSRQHTLSIYIYLFCLTFVDSVYLFLGLVRNIPEIIKTYDKQLSSYVAEHMKLGTIYLDMVFSHTSRALLIVMSLERLVALVKPFEVKHFMLAKYPRRIVAVCMLFNLIFLLPFPLYLEVQSYTVGNATQYFVQFPNYVSKAMDTYMKVQTGVDYLLPCTILFFTNIAILLTYSSINRRRLATFNIDPSTTYNQTRKITTSVFCVCLFYLLCSLPNLFIKLLAFVDGEYSFDGEYKLVFWFFIDISNLFEYINAANDAVIYILVSNYYRHIFKDMYCRSCTRGAKYAQNSSDDGPTITTSSNNDSTVTLRY